MPRTTKKIEITSCKECVWFFKKWDVYGQCRGHAPRANRGPNDPCHWPVVHMDDTICYKAEEKK